MEELFPLVYDELRRIAARKLRDERTSHTLSAMSRPTARTTQRGGDSDGTISCSHCEERRPRGGQLSPDYS